MSNKLIDLKGFNPVSASLLEAVGYTSLAELATADAAELHAELERANQLLEISESTPSQEEVDSWIEKAQQVAEFEALKVEAEEESKVEEKVEGDAVRLLVAIPVNGKEMVEQGIGVNDVPVAEVVRDAVSEDFSEDEIDEIESEPEVSPEPATAPRPRPELGHGAKRVTVSGPQIHTKRRRHNPLDAEAVKFTPDSLTKADVNFETKSRQLSTTVRNETNTGVNKNSRRYIRGVLYPEITRLKVTAIITLLAVLSIPVTFISAVMILLTKGKVWYFLPSCLVVFGLLYLMFCRRPRCRVCGQNILVTKQCLRHVKAHKFPMLGYIVPTILHLLTFKWFRCMFCGTSIRLKE